MHKCSPSLSLLSPGMCEAAVVRGSNSVLEFVMSLRQLDIQQLTELCTTRAARNALEDRLTSMREVERGLVQVGSLRPLSFASVVLTSGQSTGRHLCS
jgi:hypothetical protein